MLGRVLGGRSEGIWGGSIPHMVISSALFSPGELNSRLNSDTSLMSRWLPLNANVLLRSLVKVVGLYSFMLSLSPRLTLLSMLEVPLMIAAEKVYNVRHQVLMLGHSREILNSPGALMALESSPGMVLERVRWKEGKNTFFSSPRGWERISVHPVGKILGFADWLVSWRLLPAVCSSHRICVYANPGVNRLAARSIAQETRQNYRRKCVLARGVEQHFGSY